MKNFEMGFRHTMLQRMPNYSTTPAKMSPPPPPPPPSVKTPESVQTSATQNVTDFSINRILGEKTEKCAGVKSKPVPTPLVKPTPKNPGGILDLSKNAMTNENIGTENNFPTFRPLHNYAHIFHPNFLAATKFYAQFFPHMLPAAYASIAASQLTTNIPMNFQKRFFAPYVLNTSQHQSTTTTISSRDTTLKPPATTTVVDNFHPKTTICSRMDCAGCLDYYKPYSGYKNTPPSGMPTSSAFPTNETQHTKVKSSASMLLNSAATISLTTVTNLNLAPTKNLKFGSCVDTTSSNSEEISYKCRICDKVFGCSQTLQAHEKTHKSPRYECTDCGKGFSQLRNYKYHLSVHRGTKEFAAECPECGKTFNDKGYLSSHMKIHRNKKEYECPYCPKSFNQRVAFNMHVRIHTGVKPHKCAECGKRFSRKMLLKQHMRTHSGEKPYQCSVCGKSFADRSNMTLHHRLHSGIKPFNCPICPKAFTKKHHLKTHLNYHTGCKPYVCPHLNCNQAFTQSSNMRTHAKKCQYRPLHPLASTGQGIMPVSICTASNTLATTVTTAVGSSSAVNASLQASQFAAISGHVASSASRQLTSLNSTFTAGIRMLANSNTATTATSPSATMATTSGTLPFPPTQQPLLSTLRPL